MNRQGRLGHAGRGFAQLDSHALLVHLDQFAEKLLATAVEQLHGVTDGMPQHAAYIVGLGFRQLVLAEGKRGVDKETG